MSFLYRWDLKANWIFFFLYPFNKGKDERSQGSNIAGAYLPRRFWFSVRLRESMYLHPGASEQHSDQLFRQRPLPAPTRVPGLRLPRRLWQKHRRPVPAMSILKLLRQPLEPTSAFCVPDRQENAISLLNFAQGQKCFLFGKLTYIYGVLELNFLFCSELFLDLKKIIFICVNLTF